jgi:predicted phage terminase large subunit-like protein
VFAEYRRRRRAKEAEAARAGILPFTQYTFEGYRTNWHHGAFAKYLDWWVDGTIQNLIVEMPPRHGKSELTSRRIPAYVLGRDPNAQIIATSYGDDLASAMNRDVQRIIDSPAYKELFPETTLWGKNIRTLAQGTWLRNNSIFEIVGARGYYRSAGIGGGITGLGMTHGIIDDPIKNREEAESEVYQEKLWNWYISTFFTRLAKGGKQLITMTRWHDRDLVGRIIEQNPGKFVTVRFPAILDDEPSLDDPREYGEALWPDHKSAADLREVEATVGPYEWNSMWQQRPHAREGNMFPRDRWKFITRDEFESIRLTGQVRYWDKAGSDDHSDGARTAGIRMARAADKRIIVVDVVKGRWEAAERERHISAVAAMDNNRWTTWLEQEPGSGGKESAQATVATNAGYRFAYERPSGNKVIRADPFAAQQQAGNVYLVIAPWNEDYIAEHEAFPNGRLKDQVDGSSGAFSKVRVLPKALDPKDYPKARR